MKPKAFNDLPDEMRAKYDFDFSAAEQSQKSIDIQVDKKLWNGYVDKFSYYKKCFKIVSQLNRNQFKQILGASGLELEKEVIEYAHRR